MDNNDYLPGITQGYGARITVHDPGTIPNPQVNGFFISTAYETEVALKFVSLNFCYIHIQNYCTRKHCIWLNLTFLVYF